MHRVKTKLALFLLAALAALLVGACGSDQEGRTESKAGETGAVGAAATVLKPKEDLSKKLGRTLAAKGFGEVAEKLEAYLRPTVIATTARAREKDFRLGQSKIGGLAHLPPDFTWPTFQGLPLHFVAQINLSELPPGRVAAELPKRGLMLFFYADGLPVWGNELQDKGAAVVHHYDGDLTRLKATDKPAGKKRFGIFGGPPEFHYQPSRLTFQELDELPTSLELFDLDELLAGLEPGQDALAEEIMLEVLYGPDEYEEFIGGDDGRPGPRPSAELQKKMSDRAAQLALESGLGPAGSERMSPEESLAAFNRISALVNSDPEMQRLMAEAYEQMDLTEPNRPRADGGGDEAGYSGLHKILGWPELVQGSVFVEAQYATSGLDLSDYEHLDEETIRAVEAGVKDWRLLMQVDSDGNSEIMWGDAGTLYFLIKKDDLAAGNFDDIWFSWQCH